MPRGGAQAARARAARAFADLTLDEIASALGWSKETWGRVERGARTLNSDEIEAVAMVCELPPAFFTVDFDQLPELDQRPLRSLVADVAATRAATEALREALREQNLRLEVLELADRARSDEADQRKRGAQ